MFRDFVHSRNFHLTVLRYKMFTLTLSLIHFISLGHTLDLVITTVDTDVSNVRVGDTVSDHALVHFTLRSHKSTDKVQSITSRAWRKHVLIRSGGFQPVCWSGYVRWQSCLPMRWLSCIDLWWQSYSTSTVRSLRYAGRPNIQRRGSILSVVHSDDVWELPNDVFCGLVVKSTDRSGWRNWNCCTPCMNWRTVPTGGMRLLQARATWGSCGCHYQVYWVKPPTTSLTITLRLISLRFSPTRSTPSVRPPPQRRRTKSSTVLLLRRRWTLGPRLRLTRSRNWPTRHWTRHVSLILPNVAIEGSWWTAVTIHRVAV